MIMAKSEMKFKINTEQIESIKKTVKEVIEKREDEIKEKIAFSLFIMYYYKHHFCLEQDKYLIKMKLEELKQMWILGKMKNKLKYFFSLANQIFEMDLNNKNKKESVNDNN